MKTISTLKISSFLLVILNFVFFSAQPIPGNTRFVNPTSSSGVFTKSFVKHLNSNKDEMFYTVVNSSAEYFGSTYSFPSRLISRLDIAGLPVWTAQFSAESNDSNNGTNGDFATVDIDDNFYVVCSTTDTSSTLTDGLGAVTNFTNPSGNLQKILIKLDKNGNKIWAKSFDNTASGGLSASLNTDSVGDLYITGSSNSGITFEGVALSGTYIMKISGTIGNVIYSNVYPAYNNYIAKPIFDGSNNLYVFCEPYISSTITSYTFDGVTIPSNADNLDNLMLKFDAAGNCIFGKNFSAGSPAGSYNESWIMDVVFDGTDFIAIGDYSNSTSASNFFKLDGTTFPKHYAGTQYEGFLAKIKTDGTVLWEKALESQNSGQSVYTNLNLDSNNEIYAYLKFKSELYYDGTTYPFDTTVGDKVVMKFTNNGTLKYLDKVDKNYLSGGLIDVFAIDKYNVLGYSKQINFLSYPITNTAVEKNYVATFGNLNGIYLRPVEHYSDLSATSISNSSSSPNEFTFTLLNNVDWTVASDQTWLNISSVQLAGKNALVSSTSGNGDSQITLAADANTAGIARNANVLVSGVGVPSKTIIVSQSETLNIGESKTSLITIYPNPTSEYLNISTDKNIKKVELFDVSGKLVLSSKLESKRISVKNLQKGIYVVKIYTDNEVLNSKFIKN